MEVLEWIAKYWVNWLCALAAGGIALFAKHYVKLQKKHMEDQWAEKEKNMCGKIISTLQGKIETVETQSIQEDNQLHGELKDINRKIDSIEEGILALHGKEFKDRCRAMLVHEHIITAQEYDDFEEEYRVYKDLGGNHLGDALHDRVVEKVKIQINKDKLDRFD